jgi:predicted kinase
VRSRSLSPEAQPLFVVVNGPPASGKTTLAGHLAARLHLPLIAKDAIKEALMSAWDVPDVEASRRLGWAAMAAMLSTAAGCRTGAVLEANFHRSLAARDLRRLPGPIVEVFCACPRAVCLERYRARGTIRDPGHFDDERTDDELWNDEVAQPVADGWPVVRVDTERRADPDEVVRLVGRALASASPEPTSASKLHREADA